MRFHLTGIFTVIMVFLSSGTANADSGIFVYEGPDGTRWITDHKPVGDGFTLLKRYGYQQTAKACAGVSEAYLNNKIANFEWHINSTARVHKVEKALIKAVMRVESCFNPYVISRAGAIGLMQLMPATARRYGVKNVFNPSENIQGGVKYLKFLLGMFKNNKRLALAGYNAGENAVLKYGDIPPYRETQSYVKKVLHYYQHYKGSRQSRANQ